MKPGFQNEDPDSILRPRHAAEFLGVTLNTLHVLSQKMPNFPRKRKIGPKAVGYVRRELIAYALDDDKPMPAKVAK